MSITANIIILGNLVIGIAICLGYLSISSNLKKRKYLVYITYFLIAILVNISLFLGKNIGYNEGVKDHVNGKAKIKIKNKKDTLIVK